MASVNNVIEQRQILVQQSIPKLIKSLTGFNVSRQSLQKPIDFFIFSSISSAPRRKLQALPSVRLLPLQAPPQSLREFT
jgi:hypothetical protein